MMRAVDHVPAGYASGNTHRVVLVRPPATDAERLEDLLADGVGAARRAMAAAEGLPPELLAALAPEAERVRREVLKARRLLHDDARAALERYADAAEAWLAAAGPHDAVAAMVGDLRRAIDASHRVADLIAAGAEIRAHRESLAQGLAPPAPH